MQTLSQDLRYALRMLAKSPGFIAVAIIILALGIGANTAIFSVIYGVLIRPLAIPEARQVVQVTLKSHGELSDDNFTYNEFRRLQEHSGWPSAFAAFTHVGFNMIGASFLGESFLNPLRVNPGFRPSGVLSAEIWLTGSRIHSSAELTVFYDNLTARLKQLPDVFSKPLSSSSASRPNVAAISAALGIFGAVALHQAIASVLFGVQPTDGRPIVVSSICLLSVALFACYIPARRATKGAPMVALRYE